MLGIICYNLLFLCNYFSCLIFVFCPKFIIIDVILISSLSITSPTVLIFYSLAKDLYFLQNAEGSGLAPFDCWICLRGIKTMALRVEKQQVIFQIFFKYLFIFFFLKTSKDIEFLFICCRIYRIFDITLI
jgi:hypothetical protein